MKILDAIINLFKGDDHAGRTEESVSGGDGRERRILHSIPSICERAVSDIGSIRVLARTCADERGGDTGTLPPDPIRQESVALIAAAKQSGCFVDVAKVPGTRDGMLTFSNRQLEKVRRVTGTDEAFLQMSSRMPPGKFLSSRTFSRRRLEKVSLKYCSAFHVPT